jgi:menaquinone-dependent protoporphyrinogen IX oxidase
MIVQASNDLSTDEQHLFQFSHLKAAEIAEMLAINEQMSVERIDSVVQGQAVRTKHYETQLSSFRQASQQLKQEISVGKTLKEDQEKEAIELADLISSFRIKEASLQRLNDLGRESLTVSFSPQP